MTETKPKVNPKTEAKRKEAVEYLHNGIHDYVKSNRFTGPQISTVFKVEVLERIDLFSLRVLVPDEQNGDAKFKAWVASKEFDITKVDEKKEEFGTITCAGSNSTGRLFSKEWIERMRSFEKSADVNIISPIFSVWIKFAEKFDSKPVVSDVPKGMTQKQYIAKLQADLAQLKESEKDA